MPTWCSKPGACAGIGKAEAGCYRAVHVCRGRDGVLEHGHAAPRAGVRVLVPGAV